MSLREHWCAGEGMDNVKAAIEELVADNVFEGMRQIVKELRPDIGFIDGQLSIEMHGYEDPAPNESGIIDNISNAFLLSEIIDNASIWMSDETMREAADLLEKQAEVLRQRASFI